MKKNAENLQINGLFIMWLISLTIFLALIMPLMLNAQSEKADFAGNWVFNLSKSTPAVRGSRDTEKVNMVVTQNASTLILVTTRTREDGTSSTGTTTYNLDGKENVLTRSVGALGPPTKYVAIWAGDGKTLTIVITLIAQNADTKSTQAWTLTSANSLSIIRTINRGGTERKTVDVWDKK